MFLVALFAPWASKAQTGVTLPYSTGFETANDPAWQILNVAGSNTWQIGTAVNNGGTHALYISNDGGTSNSYTNSSLTSTNFATLMVNFAAAGSYAISFDWRCAGESSYDYLRCFLVPASTTFTAGTLPTGVNSTGTPDGWIDIGGKMNLGGATTWHNVFQILNITTPGDKKLVFVWRNDASGGSQPPAAVDNVEIAALSCSLPTALEASNLTPTSVTFTWSPGGSETEWIYQLGNRAWQTTTDTTVSFSDLVSNSNYMFRVRAICSASDTSFAVSTSIVTPCEAIPSDSLPYTYGFEDASGTSSTSTINACWTRVTNYTSTAYPYPNSTHHGTGSKSLYFYSASSYYSYAVLPLIDESLLSLQLSFYAYRSTTATYGHYAVGVMSNPSDINTFDTIAVGQVSANSVWELIEVPLNNYTGNGQYIAIMAPKCSSANYLYVDDVMVDYLPSCLRPVELAVTDVTDSSAVLTWVSSASSFVVEYGLNGFTQGNGDTLLVTTNSANLTGLRMGMTYGVFVTAICGADTSTTAYYSFNSGCSPITSSMLPYRDDFETYGSGSTYPINACWSKGTNSTTAYPYPSSTAGINSTRGLYCYGNYPSSATGTRYYSWVALPPIDDELDMSNLQVNFSAKRYSSTTAYYKSMVVVGIADSLPLLTTQSAIESLVTWIDTIDLSDSAANFIKEVEVPFDEYVGQGKYVFLYVPPVTPTASSSYTYNYIYLDDITLMNIPTCFRPVEITVESVYTDEIEISWVPDERTTSPSSWVVEYGIHGFTPGTGATLTVTDTTATITGLQSDRMYDLLVRANCGGEISDFRSVTVHTYCQPVDTLPYFEGFESYISGSTNPISSCWTKNVIGSTTAYPYPASAGAVTGQMGIMFYSASSATPVVSYAALPLFVANLTDLMVEFDFKRYSSTTSTYPCLINVGVMSDPTDISTFELVQNIDISNQAASSIHHFRVSLEGYTGDGQFIAFYAPVPTTSGCYNYVYIDNVNVDLLPTCRWPVNVAIDNAAPTQVELSWNGTASSYEVQASMSGTFDSAYTYVATGNSYIVTGLQDYTNWYFRVRALCVGGDTSWWSSTVSVLTPMDCGNGSVNIRDTIGDGTSTTTSSAFYASSSYVSGFSSSIFTTQELNNMGLQVNNRIHSISLHAGSTGGTIRQAKVYMKEVALEGFESSTVANDTVDRSTMTLVYSGDLVVAANAWVEIVLDSDFVYSGNNNLLINFCHDTNSTAATPFYYTSTSPNYYNCYGYRSSPISLGYVYRNYNRPNVIFNVCTEIPDCVRPTTLMVTGYTDTSITVEWTATASAYQLLVSPVSVDPDSVDSSAYISVNTNTYTATGLLPDSQYYFYVRSDCGTVGGQSEWTAEVAGRTACSPVAIPFTENFESYASGSTVKLNTCWRKGTNNATAYPYPYSTNAINGQRSLYFYSYNSGTASSSYYSYAALPMMDAPLDTLSLAFSMRRYNSTSTYYTSRIVVGVMDDPSDITTFTPVDTIDLYNEPVGSIHNVEVFFNNYTGTGRYIALYNSVPPLYGSGTYTYCYNYIDDIVVDYIPSCARVTNVAVDNITRTAATVHWNTVTGATYEIEYGPQGFVHGSGNTVTSTVDSVVLTGLVASTYYDVYVRAHCSATDMGEWSFVESFATECGPMTLPVFYDMESFATGSSAPLPLCWTRTNNNPTASYSYYPYIYNTSYSHSGSNSIYFYVTSSTSYPSEEIMVFPEIDTLVNPINAIEVDFWARVASYPGRHLIFGVMSNPSDMTTFVGVDTVTLTATMTEYVMNTSSYTGHGSYVAFRVNYDTTVAFSVYIDDLLIGAVSPCPRVYDLTATNGTATSVDLGWTDTIGSVQWAIEYGVLGGTATIVDTINSNPYTLTGLTPNTNYTFRAAPICSNGMRADWSAYWVNFSTALNPATVPYTYDFENAAEWANWQTASNNAIGWYRGNVAQGNTTNAMYISTDNGATHSWDMTVLTNAVAYRDIDFGATPGSYQIDFDAYIGGTIGHSYDGITVIVTDPANYVQSSNTAITTPWGHVNDVSLLTVRGDTNWGSHTVYLDSISGVKRVAFYHFNQSTGNNYAYMNNPSAIDNVSITAQTCARPYGLTVVSETETTVTLSWGGDASSDYQVAYCDKRNASSWANFSFAMATGTSITINGLRPSSGYYWRVRKICSMDSISSNMSGWSPYSEFATLCAPVSVADTLFDDFETYNGVAYNSNDGELPNCWEGYNADNNFTAHVTNGSSYSYCISGTQAVTMTSGTSASYTGGTDNYMRLVDIAEPTNTLTVAFWMCTESSTNGFLEVGYLTDTNYSTGFVAVKRINASAATVHNGNGLQTGHGIFDTVSFDSVPAGNYPVCFRWNYTTSYYSVCIDDLSVWTSLSCVAPVVSVSGIDYQSATVTASGTGISYELKYGTDLAAMNTIETNTTGVFNLTGLNPNTQYFYALRQQCDSNFWSEYSEGAFTTDELPCFTPTNLEVTATTITSATLHWTSTGSATTWVIETNGAGNQRFDTVGTNPYTVTGLYANTQYTASVRAICMIGVVESDWSDTITFTTDACPTVEGIAVSAVTSSGATASWQSANGALGYRLTYGEEGFLESEADRVDIASGTTSYTFSGLLPETEYEFYVQTKCGDDIYSNVTGRTSFVTLSSSQGIYDVESGTLTLFPNPASSNVTVTVSGFDQAAPGGIVVEIVDLNGKRISELRTQNSELQIDLSQFAQGAYFVRVTGERQTVVRKLIVR